MDPPERRFAGLRAVGAWLDDHPVGFFLALVASPVLALVAAAWLTGGGIRDAVENGLVFGVVFAAVTVALHYGPAMLE